VVVPDGDRQVLERLEVPEERVPDLAVDVASSQSKKLRTLVRSATVETPQSWMRPRSKACWQASSPPPS
jgi:hypothetical protein